MTARAAVPTVPALSLLGALAGAVLLPAAAQADAHRNVTAGGPLRPGVYGRIELRGAPPPLIYSRAVVANQPVGPVQSAPVYLYVPPGQVRKWQEACARWQACDRPVYFVRMDASPSRWGAWRQLRDQVARGPEDD